MATFKKSEKPTPAISTASLPDIVFMLLFFFMVVTKMREQEINVKQRIPEATQLQTIEQKSLVSYIYVGEPKKRSMGKEARIQVNDVFTTPEGIPQYVQQERSKLKENERPLITMSLKVDEAVKMGLLTDVKLQLREADARKINYSTRKIKED
ncbi:MAG: biopolymer transporter ExbD [Cytophagales bacterium]|nr:MAG: biopolymer transporter ExbD [Cytophagales bacterium]